MIVTHDLSKHFGDVRAVDGIDLQVNAGEILALLGPNGAGKTTTVRMLTSILRPTRGSACVAGFDVVREARMVRASVGVLTEQHGLYNRMRAEEYLDFFGQIYGMDYAIRHRRIQRLLKQFNLSHDRKRRITEYSKGMRQKLALARTLLHDPPVLLLDEPTSAMDPESARLVRDAIRELRSGSRTIVVCTHNLSEAEEFADQIAIIRHGKIDVQGTPTELKESLLGPSEYEIRLNENFNGYEFKFPGEISITSRGTNWMRYRTRRPDEVNPMVLRYLLERGLGVVSLYEVRRSLEQVYLQAVNNSQEEETLSG